MSFSIYFICFVFHGRQINTIYVVCVYRSILVFHIAFFSDRHSHRTPRTATATLTRIQERKKRDTRRRLGHLGECCAAFALKWIHYNMHNRWIGRKYSADAFMRFQSGLFFLYLMLHYSYRAVYFIVAAHTQKSFHPSEVGADRRRFDRNASCCIMLAMHVYLAPTRPPRARLVRCGVLFASSKWHQPKKLFRMVEKDSWIR